ATPPSRRLLALQAALENGFHAGVSLMPLLPYISDKGEHLEQMFATFAALKVNYLFPASITLFGEGRSDSKTLVFRAVEKHYLELLPKYQNLFANRTDLPDFYKNAFY